MVQVRTVAALLATLVGLAVLGGGFVALHPMFPIALGLAGLGVGLGGLHLWNTVPGGERAQSRSEGTTPDIPNPDGDPVEILKVRYARGDIDDEEFERRIGRLVKLGSEGDSEPARTDEVRARER